MASDDEKAREPEEQESRQRAESEEARETREKQVLAATGSGPSLEPAAEERLARRRAGAAALQRAQTAEAQALEDGPLSADSSDDLAASASSFGDVLLAIGAGVASSQEALDRGFIATATRLSDTEIDVVDEVVVKLDDQGQPIRRQLDANGVPMMDDDGNPIGTELIRRRVSLINFVRPVAHRWERVAVSMDLSVGAVSTRTGVTFSQFQAAGGATFRGPWGFSGWFSASASVGASSREDDAEWAQGQVRLDALLRRREADAFPRPAEVTIGPQISFSPGSSQSNATSREIELTITVRKADGAPNPSRVLQLETAPLLPIFDATGGFLGSTTNPAGRVRLTLRRPAGPSDPPLTVPIIARFGDLTRTFDITL